MVNILTLSLINLGQLAAFKKRAYPKKGGYYGYIHEKNRK